MRRILQAAGALALAAVLSQAGAAAAQTSGSTGAVPGPKAQGGNKALMEDWVRKKQALRDQVYEDLRSKGLLPRDGVVTFDALVKPDPRNPGRVTVKIESMTITERPKGQRQGGAFPQAKNDPIFGARAPNGHTQAMEASIPIGGGTMRETITIVGGKPQEQARP